MNDRTPIYVYDIHSSEYVAYYEEFPSVVSQGKTKEEALINLERDYNLYMEMLNKD